MATNGNISSRSTDFMYIQGDVTPYAHYALESLAQYFGMEIESLGHVKARNVFGDGSGLDVASFDDYAKDGYIQTWRLEDTKRVIHVFLTMDSACVLGAILTVVEKAKAENEAVAFNAILARTVPIPIVDAMHAYTCVRRECDFIAERARGGEKAKDDYILSVASRIRCFDLRVEYIWSAVLNQFSSPDAAYIPGAEPLPECFSQTKLLDILTCGLFGEKIGYAEKTREAFGGLSSDEWKTVADISSDMEKFWTTRGHELVSRNGGSFRFEMIDDIDEQVDAFAEIGVRHYMDLYFDGVSIEDVVA